MRRFHGYLLSTAAIAGAMLTCGVTVAQAAASFGGFRDCLSK
jgi:hypothetical protein